MKYFLLDMSIFVVLWLICFYVAENMFPPLPTSLIMLWGVVTFVIVNSLSAYLAGKIVKEG